MKRTVLTVYVALLLCFLLLLGQRSPAVPSGVSPSPPGAERPPVPEAAAVPEPAPPSPPRRIRLLTGDGILELDEEDYLLGVVAAEMPASFPTEALKAQAVAARTYARYCAEGGKHAEADVCADPGCCQAWQDEPALREKWGGQFEEYRDKLRRAVEETRGQLLVYEGQPVFAAFHASSPGATEDCGRVWNPRPYLLSVPSPETAETVPDLESRLCCEALDLRDTILSARPEADFSGPADCWLGEVCYDESGRVEALELGGVSLSGTEMRSLFSLRSAAFTLEYREGQFCFTVRGSGHGVGMSQQGARLMAEEGADYREILAHYYTGTELVQ